MAREFGKCERNPAVVELLEFYGANELSIMNTWFQKKEMHQGTWTHPATKQCHTIDFVVMRANQRVHCRRCVSDARSELLDGQ